MKIKDKLRPLTRLEIKFIENLKIDSRESKGIKEIIRDEWRKRRECQVIKERFSLNKWLNDVSLKLLIPLYAVVIWINYLYSIEMTSIDSFLGISITNIDKVMSMFMVILLFLVHIILVFLFIGTRAARKFVRKGDLREKDRKLIFDSKFLRILKRQKWQEVVKDIIIYLAITVGLGLSFEGTHIVVFILYSPINFIISHWKKEMNVTIVHLIKLIKEKESQDKRIELLSPK